MTKLGPAQSAKRRIRSILGISAMESARDVHHDLSQGTHDARDTAVLIVSYGAAAKLNKCLLSVKKFLPAAHVYVWDNSGPQCSEIRKLASEWPDITWHFSDTNLGFAAGVNRLAEMAPTSDILLLNPDAILLCSLDRTINELRQPGVACVGPLDAQLSVGNAGDEEQRKPWDTSYKKLTVLNFFAGVTGVEYKFRGTPLSYRYGRQPYDVDGFLSGCCLLISRSAWDSIGTFDEKFFLYQEEAEWQRRAIDAGWKVRLVDELGIYHESRGTVAGDAVRSLRSEDLAFAGAVLMGERCFGVPIAELYLAWTCTLRKIKSLVSRSPRLALDVILLADQTHTQSQSIVRSATELSNLGLSVAVVSLESLGNIPQNLPPSIRLLRRPWWCPSLGPYRVGLVATSQEPTRKTKYFQRLFRIIHRDVVDLDWCAARASVLQQRSV